MPTNENYIVVQGFMSNELHLKGNELLAYAIVYGFSQDGESECTASLSYFQKWLNTSKQTVINVLAGLVEKGLILKHERVISNVHFNAYSAVLPVVKFFDGGSQNFLPNKLTDNKDSLKKEIKERKFVVPSVEEIRAYCEERKNGIDPQYFWDWYDAKGWKIGNGSMKSWKSAVRTWEARQRGNKPKQTEKDYSEFYL